MKITEAQIDGLIADSSIITTKMGKKTTVVHLTLPNGFEIVESAACLDPNSYDEEIGEKVALERIRDKLFLVEGYLLQQRLARF